MITLNYINKSYSTLEENLHVLKNLNIEVNDGEFIAIMGESGSGKSTLIKIIGLLDEKYTGEYLFDGINVKTLSDNQKSEFRNSKIGFIFQNFNLIQRITVEDNIKLPFIYKEGHFSEAKKKATKLLETVGLKDKATNFPYELSGGQQQRVAIARALINEPKLIIADEPTGALDKKNSIEIINILQKLNKEKGTTIIMVTHDINVANFSDRIITINDGKIEYSGCVNDEI